MPLVSMNEFLPKAKAGKFAVGQFNINNLEFTQAITEAAMEENAPIIFGVSEGALRYMEWNIRLPWRKRLRRNPACQSLCILTTAAHLKSLWLVSVQDSLPSCSTDPIMHMKTTFA